MPTRARRSRWRWVTERSRRPSTISPSTTLRRPGPAASGMRCADKAGVVTGTSRGLGREILLALAREGASVVGVARDADGGNEAVAEASQAGGRAVFQTGDVRREEDVVAGIQRCRNDFGRLDFIVNNAGILGEGRLHETS